MKKALFLLCLFFLPFCLQAQHTIRGSVSDTSGYPIPYTTVSLLKPEDSTLAFFGIVNGEGNFEIADVKADKYLLQAAFMGFKTYYRPIDIPLQNERLGRIVLKSLAKELAEVEISTEKVPLMIKKDTIEYNASAFKTRPDASTEELLKRLPGIEVDRAGNIKAQGEGVSKVLVDGKEFFGDDPKVATKNLPADAIKKVQVFNKKSDAADFTGIDDGTRERTINLMLKEGKKTGYFGDLQAGVGTDDRYKLNAKVYKFTKKTQFAALGLMNNINEAGFSVQDYINFSGGIRNLLSGGADNLGRSFANAPVDFGRPVTGQITSGAGGLNYSYEYGRNRRVALSYLGNGSDKKLDQRSYVRNFTNTETFTRNSNEKEIERSDAHRFTMNWRDDLDSSQQITLYATAGLTQSKESSEGISKSLVRDVVLNQLDSRNMSRGDGMTGNGSASYLKRLDGNLSVLKASGTISYSNDLSKTQWQNLTSFLGSHIISDNQFQNVTQEDQNYTGTLSAIYNLKKGFYLEPEITGGIDMEHLVRRQGPQNGEAMYVDSISPDFQRTYQYIRPELSLRSAQQKVRYGVSLAYENGFLHPDMANARHQSRSFSYLLPSLTWENDYSQGKRLNFSYNSSVNAPAARQLLPVPNITSPLSKFSGNINLNPEYAHTARFGWLWFDQFSFTSLFTSLSGTYTKDKINTSRIIYPNLSEERTLVNVSDDYRADAGISYNTPIRKLGITLNASVNETFNKGINLVNNVSNHTTTLTHGLKSGVSNRKKDKFDIEVGASGSLSDALYSIDKDLNNVFFSLTGFTEMSYRPNDHWYFGVTADITQYNAKSFQEAIVVPLLKSQVSYYFMKFNRGVLSVEGFDLLNKNKSVQRISELNYLSEIRSNVIGQYFMLSFKYRLSKAGKSANVLDVNLRQR